MYECSLIKGLKEAHNLSRAALNDIVQNTTTIVYDAVKSACVNIVNHIKNEVQENNVVLQTLTWQTYEENMQATNPFAELETETMQRQAFKQVFGHVVRKQQTNFVFFYVCG